MDLIEIEAKILEGGMIQIPKAELESTGLRKGDEVCLLYLTQSDDNRRNDAKEFILERQVENRGREKGMHK